MRCRSFESAASVLVDESLHPLEQIKHLDAQASDRVALGDSDCIIECRIKQLSLHKVLVHLYDHPLPDLIRAQAVLAEAYSQGGYHKQARDHLARAREACIGGVFDDSQSQRLQVDILIAEGTVRLVEATASETARAQEERLEKAEAALQKAARIGREVFGDMGVRAVRIYSALGKIAMQRGHHAVEVEKQRGHHAVAVQHLSEARKAQEKLDSESEEMFRLEMRMAEAQFAGGKASQALETQTDLVERLRPQSPQEPPKFPELLVDALAQQARWLEQRAGEEDNLLALQALEDAEEHIEEEDPKALNIKRDIALLHLKMGKHDDALKYLNEVHYLERCLHGSQSTNVGRTLKALGTVHLVRQRFGEAQECLMQALHIFEADHPPNQAIIRDIHAKLVSIAQAVQSQR